MRTPTSIALSSQPSATAALKLRAANSLATMLAGLIGCALGVVAYRRGR